MPLENFKRRGLMLKVETTEGTDAAPTAAVDAFQLFDGQSGITSDKIERPVDRPFFGNDPFINANLRGFVEGGFEIVPPTGTYSGASKASVDALLQIAGNAKTYAAGPPPILRYNPVSSGIKSGTGWFHHAGTLYKITGARANITGLSMEIGNFVRGQCRIEGSCIEVLEAALPTDYDFSAFTVPVVNSTETMEMKVNGVTVEGKRLSIDYGNAQQTIEHTEARIGRIRERKPTFDALFYRPSKANLDPWALWKAGTIIPLWATVTDAANNRLSRLLVRGQIEEVQPTDIDGDLGYQVRGRCIPSDTGGDEFLLEFEDTTP